MLGQIVEERYLVEAELGEGAMGRVYRARHVKVGRQVAIKVMHRELARVPTIVERFAREARVAARLNHPNLIGVLDVGMTPDRLPLIVLELAPGTSMYQLMLGAMPRERVVSLTRQLLLGLGHAHAAGLVHRDLKPDNILVETRADGTEIPRIVDFGIAVCNTGEDPIANRRLTDANTVIGTPSYMSPEQAMAKQLDARTDLFSLGVIVYEMLAGMAPFAGSGVDVAMANASKDAPSIAERAGIDVDPLLEAFARKLMARRLADRFQTAHDALIVLDLIESDRIAAARALSAPVATPLPIKLASTAAIATTPRMPDNSDRLATAPVTAVPLTADAVTAAPAAAALSSATIARREAITRVEAIAAVRPSRRRRTAALALAVAAMTAFAGWSFHDGDAPAAKVSSALSAPSAPSAAARPTLTPASAIRVESIAAAPAAPAPEAQVADAADAPAAPAPEAQVADAADAQVADAADAQVADAADAPVAPSRSVASTTVESSARPVAKRTTAKTAVAPKTARNAIVNAAASSAATAQVETHAAVEADTASTLAARYVAIGEALRGAPDDLWARYRLIRINDALKSEASRREAFVALAEIERSLKTR